MCGICGVLHLDGGRVDRAVLEDMNAALEHRGPDSAGVLVKGPMGLAMRRLSIIDLQTGDQPIGNEDDSITVIQNGEIYNYRELRRDLERAGHRFRTRSDTEVLVHLYEQHGVEFLERLRGMFALALWDARRRRLVLARDRFGIKPLYYRVGGDAVTFASELKSLLRQPDVGREIDPEALEAFLTFGWVPTPLTIFREARKLPAGSALVADDGKIAITRYARPGPVQHRETVRCSFDSLATELRDRLRDSVRAHLVADVPVGVFLSGGVDSSLICALAAGEVTGPVKTFSIGFTDASYNELDKARLVARRFATDHHELVVQPDAVALLPQVISAFDEPFADTSALPTYLVSQLAAQHVKVALTGEGADELFGGYFTYAADRIAPAVGPLVGPLRPLIDRLPSTSHALRLDDKAKRFARGARMQPLERHVSWGEVFEDGARDTLLEPDRRGRAEPLAAHRARYAETVGADPLARLQDVDLGVNLVDDQLTKTDRASMAHSLEARVPFLDPVVCDFALSVPSRHNVRGLAKKRLLRAAAAPLLPSTILSARKQGFTPPTSTWLRGELREFAQDALAAATLRRHGFFRPQTVEQLFRYHLSRRADRSRQLWSLLIFTLWYENTLRGDGRSSVGTGASAPT
jgi:asparagine synthase (glutamine-hydrolysing)